MTVLKYIILAIYVIICIALIIIATIQTKDYSGGASGAITGSSTNNFYEKNKGRTKEGKIKRVTIILGIAFIVTSIILGVLYTM